MTIDHKVPKHVGSITLAVGNPNWGLEQCETIARCNNAINKEDELLHCIYPISPSPRIHLVTRDAEDFVQLCPRMLSLSNSTQLAGAPVRCKHLLHVLISCLALSVFGATAQILFANN